jgi:hypothetical protein
MKRERESGCAE